MAEKEVKQTQKERLKEITDSIETGIQNLFESDKYMQYLRTMSRFHKYSLNNTMLIAMQRPDATLVAGFNKWKDGFSRYVKKGEKGIKIIAPTPYKITEEREKLDPITKAPLLDNDGKVQTEEVERQIPMFRVTSVFDISQTDGKEIPTLAANLMGDVERFDEFMEAIKRTSPVPIAFEKMADDTDGYYHLEDERIAIREGMSEVQTISATIHEVAHSLLHNREKAKEAISQTDETATLTPKKNRNTEEVEAESISFAVCNYYGIETGDNSFGYIANWSKDKELKELKSSLETINQTSSQIITGIDKHFAEILKERDTQLSVESIEPEQYPEQVAFSVGENYLTIQTIEDGYDYNFYDKDFNLIDGGVYDDPEWTIFEVAKELITEDGETPVTSLNDYPQVDYDEITEKAENVELSKIVGTIKYSDITNDFVKSSQNFKDEDLPLYTNRDGDRFAFGFGELGNGTTVWNFLEETDNDYTTVANISETGEINYLVDNLPDTAKSALEKIARNMGLQNEFDNPRDNIEVKGHIGTWYVIDTETIEGKEYSLLEHEEHGDEAACVIIDDKGELVLDDVRNGFDDLKEHLADINAPHTTPESEHYTDNSYPMPDETVSFQDAKQYGYTSKEILPLGKERATELFEEDLTIYALHPDNTEAMLFEIEEVDSHAGYFGIEKADWEAFYEFEELKNKDWSLSEETEKAFIDAKVNSYAIYQLKSGEENHHYRFTGTKELEQLGLEIDRNRYNLVYADKLQNCNTVDGALNALYYDFNHDKPEDFIGHSLSVSDIIALNMDGMVSSHYVDSFGFKEQRLFLRDVEIYDFIGVDHFFVDDEDGKLTWMYFNEDGSDGGHFVENNLYLQDVIEAAKETKDHDEFFEILTEKSLQYLGDVGTEHFYNMKEQFVGGNQLCTGVDVNSMHELIKKAENYLRATELTKEQNFNMIDGTINNESLVGKIDYLDNNGKVVETMEYTDKADFDKQVKENHYYGVPMVATLLNQPTVAQLEHDAKNGKPISVMDLLAATRREQQQKPPESKKEKAAPSKGAEMER